MRRKSIMQWSFTLAMIALLWLGSAGFGMDQVRTETNTDAAVARYGVTGKGVIVAILDRGIDWRHPDFLNPDGTTRIKWLLDMSNAGPNPCDPNDPPPIEYSEAQINAALQGGPQIASRDAVGHGTVTAGLAAGNGSAFANGKYRGMAPEADLIIVKLTSEGAPAHGDQPAEPFFQGCIETALDWLDAKITELDRPCVGLINSGIQWGPIDGTSAVSRKIDEVFGQHRPGRVYVAASGDDGEYASHAADFYDETIPTIVRFTKWSTQSAYLPLWYSGQAPAGITVQLDDGTVLGPAFPGDVLSENGVAIYAYWPGFEFYPWQSTSGDYAVNIWIDSYVGGGSIEIQAINPSFGRFDLYHAGFDPVLTLDDHLTDGRLTDYASTRSAISVGAHVNRDAYHDIDGQFRMDTSEGAAGELWLHSSGGPTRDGRLGIDLTTPGHSAFAAYAPDSYWATFRFNLIQDGGGWYGRGGATSGSAPIAVGAVALILDLCPGLDAEQVRQILHDTAVTDLFTGPTPNINWGYGKLDMLAALDAVHALCAGDYDFDSDVDADDYALFEACQTGPAIGPPPADCDDRDLDGDGDVDQSDFGLFQRCWTGPEATVSPGCTSR